MDALPDPATMTDDAILREWEAIDCDIENITRTNALADELNERQIPFYY